jgi:hypothetical protein
MFAAGTVTNKTPAPEIARMESVALGKFIVIRGMAEKTETVLIIGQTSLVSILLSPHAHAKLLK